MKRRALIIYCTNTDSGPLAGPHQDARNLLLYLTSAAGGNWYTNEIKFLRNPNAFQIERAMATFLDTADYTFTVFSGHGYIDLQNQRKQYLEVQDQDIELSSLYNSAPRQTIIVDACRTYVSSTVAFLEEEYSKAIGDIEQPPSTRSYFDNAVLKAEEGQMVLFAASDNQTAKDTPNGGAYLLSLLMYAQEWSKKLNGFTFLPLNTAHLRIIPVMQAKFDTNQQPNIVSNKKRTTAFPLAVKHPNRNRTGF